MELLNPTSSLKTKGDLIALATELERELIARDFLTLGTGVTPNLGNLAALGPERVEELKADLSETLSELRKVAATGVDKSLRRTADVEQLKNYLQTRRHHLRDQSFFDLIAEDDVIEIYDHRFIQVWRNWAFFKVCPYTMSELVTNSWDDLFARPSWVVQRLTEMAPLVFSPEGKTLAYDLPEYLLSARRFPEANSMLFTMKYVTPVCNHVGQTIGFLTTGSLRVMDNLKVGRQIDFI